MGLLDDAENLMKDNKSEVANLTQQGEQFADQETGNNFDSEIQAAGTAADNYVEGQN